MTTSNENEYSEFDLPQEFEAQYIDTNIDDDVTEPSPEDPAASAPLGFSVGVRKRSLRSRKRSKPLTADDASSGGRSKRSGPTSPEELAAEAAAFLAELDTTDARFEAYLQAIRKLSHLRSSALAGRIRAAWKHCHKSNIQDQKLFALLNKITSPHGQGDQLLCIGEDNGEWYLNQKESYLVDNLLVEGELSLVAGKSGVAKTLFLILMLAAVLNGEEEFLKQKIAKDAKDRPVFYFALDSSGAVYGEYARKAGLVNADGTGFVPGLHVIPQDASWFLNDEGLGALEDLLKTKAPGGGALVVVDSLSAATLPTGINENSTEISLALMDLKRSCAKYGAASVVLLHQQKNCLQDDIGTDSIRGSSNLPAFAYKVITLNHLDVTSSVGNRKLSDRKNPKRRLFAGHRGTQLDLLVEFLWDEWKMINHGDFEEALYMAQAELTVEEMESPSLFRKAQNDLSDMGRRLFSVLCQHKDWMTLEELAASTSKTKDQIRRPIKDLKSVKVNDNLLVETEQRRIEGSHKPVQIIKASDWSLKYNQDY